MKKEKFDQLLQDFDNKYQTTNPKLSQLVHALLQEREVDRVKSQDLLNTLQRGNVSRVEEQVVEQIPEQKAHLPEQ